MRIEEVLRMGLRSRTFVAIFFGRKSRTFEDILGLRSCTFVAILEQELRIGNSRLRMRIEEVLRMMIRIRIED